MENRGGNPQLVKGARNPHDGVGRLLLDEKSQS